MGVCLYNYTEIRNLADNLLISGIDDFIWRANLRKEDVDLVTNTSFWQEVLKAWSELTYAHPVNITQIKNEPLWLNSLIRINGVPIINKRAINEGLISLEHILDASNIFCNYEQIKEHYNNAISMLDYFAIIDVILWAWKRILKSNTG